MIDARSTLLVVEVGFRIADSFRQSNWPDSYSALDQANTLYAGI